MTITICACGETTRDGATFGDQCATNLTQALAEVPWLAEELNITASRQQGIDYRALGGAQSSETPLPIHLGASQAKTDLGEALFGLVTVCQSKQVRHQSPDDEHPAFSLESMAAWLLCRVDGLSLIEEGPHAVVDVVGAVDRARRVIDRAPDKLYAGRCGHETEGAECPEDLYAHQGARDIRCRTCGTTWDVSERRAWLLQEAEEVLAPAIEIARAVSWLGQAPLTPARVRQWASRGRLEVRGHNREGQPLYRVGDAIDLMAGGAA